MDPKEYEKNAIITESKDFNLVKTLLDDKMIRLLHAGLGMSSEIAELVRALKSTDLDLINISEEVADIAWYAAIATNALEFDHEKISSLEAEGVEWGKTFGTLEICAHTAFWAIGEFNNLLKKSLFHGKILDSERIRHNLMQLCACLSAISYFCKIDLSEARKRNIDKLKIRYGNKFTEESSSNRDLDSERKVLEEK
jgi:hypothetical protein